MIFNNDDAKLHFTAQNSHGYAKEFLRKLSTFWVRVLKYVRQVCPRYIYNCSVYVIFSTTQYWSQNLQKSDYSPVIYMQP
jgi:hypothetical protein